MASVVPRKNKQGEVTSYQVRWRLGGSAGAPGQTERFDDEVSAKVFKEAVDDAGQQWPPGWVKGRGYVDDSAAELDDVRYRFENFARASIANRAGVEERYRDAIAKEAEMYLFPTFGNCDVRSTEHFSKATVSAWQNQMCQTYVWRGSKRKLMAPKTVKNLRGLLSSLLDEAVKHEPPLRDRNPCQLVRLPRTDADSDDEEDDGGEEMEFLTPDEVEGIASSMAVEAYGDLVRDKYATGFRWSEITALARRHLLSPESAGGRHPRAKVARAWKWSKQRGYYLGKPKSRRSRRTIRVDRSTWASWGARGILALAPNALVYTGPRGDRLRYSTFWDHWQTAVQRAKKAGLVPEWKRPTPHDLRHSHAAALLSQGHSLTYVQRRLGHEDIRTTSNRYGHLLPEADDAAMETVEASLGGPRSAEAVQVAQAGASAPVEGAPTVFVAHLDSTVVGFWSAGAAEEMAELWSSVRGGSVRVERWTWEWWVRMMPTKQGQNHAALVRDGAPARVYAWRVGPAVYAADGTEVLEPGVCDPRGTWVWDFEHEFTDERATFSVAWRPASTVTEAVAWGTARDAVEAAFTRAREEALRVCSLHPEAQEVRPGADPEARADA